MAVITWMVWSCGWDKQVMWMGYWGSVEKGKSLPEGPAFQSNVPSFQLESLVSHWYFWPAIIFLAYIPLYKFSFVGIL